jgi:hypothetical protein
MSSDNEKNITLQFTYDRETTKANKYKFQMRVSYHYALENGFMVEKMGALYTAEFEKEVKGVEMTPENVRYTENIELVGKQMMFSSFKKGLHCMLEALGIYNDKPGHVTFFQLRLFRQAYIRLVNTLEFHMMTPYLTEETKILLNHLIPAQTYSSLIKEKEVELQQIFDKNSLSLCETQMREIKDIWFTTWLKQQDGQTVDHAMTWSLEQRQQVFTRFKPWFIEYASKKMEESISSGNIAEYVKWFYDCGTTLIEKINDNCYMREYGLNIIKCNEKEGYGRLVSLYLMSIYNLYSLEKNNGMCIDYFNEFANKEEQHIKRKTIYFASDQLHKEYDQKLRKIEEETIEVMCEE